jgi:hypothetical protein
MNDRCSDHSKAGMYTCAHMHVRVGVLRMHVLFACVHTYIHAHIHRCGLTMRHQKRKLGLDMAYIHTYIHTR